MISSQPLLVPIQPEESNFQQFIDLYKSAFPKVERRSEEKLISMFENPRFYPNIILLENQFIGLFNYWNFDSFYYLEHFALEKSHRNQGFGKKVLHGFLKEKAVVLECELPLNETSEKRLQFYSELGFLSFPYKYIQPPYFHEHQLIELLLLTNNFKTDESTFNQLRTTIAEHVY